MILLPAIDLMGGQVVRLVQGKASESTVYSDDPVGTAKRWASLGAVWLHVVDLDGAFTGAYRNIELIEEIIRAVACRVEVSGGIRTEAALARAFEIGAARVVLGTKAAEDPKFVERAVKEFGDRIAVAIDMRQRGGVAFATTAGWTQTTTQTAVGLARTMVGLGVATLIATDTARDGTLAGPNLTMLKDLLSSVKASVIASGGISSLEDLLTLKTLEPQGLTGAILGKALYDGVIELRDAMAQCRS